MHFYKKIYLLVLIVFSDSIFSVVFSGYEQTIRKKELIVEIIKSEGRDEIIYGNIKNRPKVFVEILKKESHPPPKRILDIIVEEMEMMIEIELHERDPVRKILIEAYSEYFTINELESLNSFWSFSKDEILNKFRADTKKTIDFEFKIWWDSLKPELHRRVNLRFQQEGIKEKF